MEQKSVDLQSDVLDLVGNCLGGGNLPYPSFGPRISKYAKTIVKHVCPNLKCEKARTARGSPIHFVGHFWICARQYETFLTSPGALLKKTRDFFASVKQYETFRPITRVSRLASLNSGRTVRDFLKKLRTVQLEREKSRTVFRVCVLGQFGPEADQNRPLFNGIPLGSGRATFQH